MTAGARQVFTDSVHQIRTSMMNSGSGGGANSANNNNNNNNNNNSGSSTSSSNSSIDSQSHSHGGGHGHGHGPHGPGHGHGHGHHPHSHSILFGQITRTMTNNNSVMVLDSANNMNNIMGAGGGGGIKKTNNKPLMEKRRRARINKSLLELERLIILPNQDLKKGAAAKLEKADILEMTVKYLREMCEVQESHAAKWKAGYNECTKSVKHYLESNGHFTLCRQLTHHLLTIDNPPPNFLVAPPISMPEPPVPVVPVPIQQQLELTINCNSNSHSHSPASVATIAAAVADEQYEHEMDHEHFEHEPEQPVNLAKFNPNENDSMWRPWSLRPTSARCCYNNGYDLSPHPPPHPHSHPHPHPRPRLLLPYSPSESSHH